MSLIPERSYLFLDQLLLKVNENNDNPREVYTWCATNR